MDRLPQSIILLFPYSTIIFPMPMNILDHFMDRGSGGHQKELEDKSD